MELTKFQKMSIVMISKTNTHYQIEVMAQRVKDIDLPFNIMVHPIYNQFGEAIEGGGYGASDYKTGAAFPIGRGHNFLYPEEAAQAVLDLIEKHGVDKIKESISKLEAIN